LPIRSELIEWIEPRISLQIAIHDIGEITGLTVSYCLNVRGHDWQKYN
jgi:hypothetical protein